MDWFTLHYYRKFLGLVGVNFKNYYHHQNRHHSFLSLNFQLCGNVRLQWMAEFLCDTTSWTHNIYRNTQLVRVTCGTILNKALSTAGFLRPLYSQRINVNSC